MNERPEPIVVPAEAAQPSKPRRRWKKVQAPKKWNPAPGEVLEGVYRGWRAAEGALGTYFTST